MPLISIKKFRCKKCGTIYERPVLLSLNFCSKDLAKRSFRLMAESEKPCPKCGGAEVVKASFWDHVLTLTHIKKLAEKYNE
jgi:phage FluMu protein Com